ncbi:AraC family transcriptional regulator [Agaribacter marinus]|uniref:AraC family transcriptional regulator n=1 Tax=Agaribacter marinus TaxID=1431249 RepID=A0AA37T1U0_9ALTE|nr:AraC family transcriptional regulator [Agaribacter marinus]GLR72149.1 AraC family transcriptional regulator [Agaribacter marinus]
MGDSVFSKPIDIKAINFVTNKYQQKLLVDVAWIHEMPSFRKTTEPYTLNFYDVTLITGGTGSFWLDEKHYELKPQQILFTTPGQVRRWYTENLEGICLFFPASFFLKEFNDPLLLHRFNYFHTKIGPENLVLDQDQNRALVSKLSTMQHEIAHLRTDSQDVLLAKVYDALLYINRIYTKQFGQVQEKTQYAKISKFRHLLDRQFHRYHKVAEYASMLALTPGHLNVLCNAQLGCSASTLIKIRLFTEAKRQLIHSNVSIEELSEVLGFTNTSYFCRAFKHELGCTPLQYRKTAKLSKLYEQKR